MGLVVFVVSTLSLLYIIGFSNGVVTPPSWDLINFLNDYSFPSTRFDSSVPQIITKFGEDPPPP